MNYIHLDQRHNRGNIDQRFYINLKPWREYYTLELHSCLCAVPMLFGYVFQMTAFNHSLAWLTIRILATVIAILGMYAICKSAHGFGKRLNAFILRLAEQAPRRML